MLAAIAVGGSSFTNAKKVITSNFLIQPLSGIFIQATTANGTCWNLGSGMQCKYAVTDLGRWNIPSQTVYFDTDVREFIYEGWLELAQSSNAGLYLIL